MQWFPINGTGIQAFQGALCFFSRASTKKSNLTTIYAHPVIMAEWSKTLVPIQVAVSPLQTQLHVPLWTEQNAIKNKKAKTNVNLTLYKLSYDVLRILFTILVQRVVNSLIGCLSKLLDCFTKKRANERFAIKKTILSFLVSDLSESLTVAHFWCAAWGIHSQPLFCHEQPERFAHIAL